jgi:hypothetical protein
MFCTWIKQVAACSEEVRVKDGEPIPPCGEQREAVRWRGRRLPRRPPISWFDSSKEMHGDFRHRALRHHTQGVFECERVFGQMITNSGGREIPVRWVAEQHVIEDLGFLPTLSDWLSCIRPKPWMTRSRRLSADIEEKVDAQNPARSADKHVP